MCDDLQVESVAPVSLSEDLLWIQQRSLQWNQGETWLRHAVLDLVFELSQRCKAVDSQRRMGSV